MGAFSSKGPKVEILGYFIAGTATSSIVLLISLVLFILGAVGVLKVSFRKTVPLVLIAIFLSAAFRLCWWPMEYLRVYENERYIFNRLSWMFGILAFLLLLIGWIEVVHMKHPPPSNKFVPAVGIVLLVLGGIVVIFTVVIIILAFTFYGNPSNNSGDSVYEIHIIFNASVLALLSVGFLVYGIVLIVRIRASPGSKSQKQRIMLLKVIVLMVTCFVCFAMRAFIFFYRPITQKFLPIPVFYVFGYLLPDAIPPLCEMWVLIATSVSKKKYTSSGRTDNTSLLSPSASAYSLKEPLVDQPAHDL